MNKVLAALIVVTATFEARAAVQEQAHYSLQGHRGETAPQVLQDQVGKSPELAKHPIQEQRVGGNLEVFNPHESRPLQFALRVLEPAEGCSITLLDGGEIKSNKKVEPGQFFICKGAEAYVADNCRKKIADLTLTRPAALPEGASKFLVEFPGKIARFDLTVWIAGASEEVKR